MIVDDLLSTGGTIAAAVRALLAADCKPDISVVVTHGLSGGTRLGAPECNVAIFTAAKRLEPPVASEGFDQLFSVRVTPDRVFTVRELV